MNKHILLSIIVILSSCGTTEINFGKYEQVIPYCEISNPTERSEESCEFESRYSWGFEVGQEYFRIYQNGEVFSEGPYQLHGRTLVAEDRGGSKWVVFFENSDLAHMSAYSFKRVSDAVH